MLRMLRPTATSSRVNPRELRVREISLIRKVSSGRIE